VARDPAGRVIVVDFKTDREADPEELARRHGAQLRAYATAVGQALGLSRPPAAEIWAVRGGTIVPVERDSP
jgi:ATP-dependent exoDNAse (exonuclease V) beta subunit